MAGASNSLPRRTLAQFRRPPGQALRTILGMLRDLVYMTPLYPLTLVGRTPKRLAVTLSDPWPGDIARGHALLEGRYGFAGQTIGAGAEPLDSIWNPPGASDAWRAELHGFNWLKDMLLAGGDDGRQRAREFVTSWIDHHQRWERLAWRADVTADRVSAWLGQFAPLTSGAGPEFQAKLLASLARQHRHLARLVPGELVGAGKIHAIRGLVTCEVLLSGGRRRLRRVSALLEGELNRYVLVDGGYIERSPSRQLSVLRDLVTIRSTLVAGRQTVPESLQIAIDRMAPMLRFFRHGDGGLALFNGSNEEEAWLVDFVLTQANARGKPLASAPHSGFERINNSRTLIIVDVGAPSKPPLAGQNHAGTLSFEMSAGKHRLITNCGASAGSNPGWRHSLRTTAAHSTLNLDDSSSSEIFDGGRFGDIIGRHPTRVISDRQESDGAVWLDASHDGYARPFGLLHRRRLYLSAGGDDLRGEDILTPTGHGGGQKGSGRKFAVRFHLHPEVKVSLVQDGSAALLNLPGGGWQLRSSGGWMGLEESIYLGVRGEVKRTQQVVIRGEAAAGETHIKWSLSRLTDGA
ncbi:MAG: heparinase II/III family protein [Alphaproteobacteria bacterium]